MISSKVVSLLQQLNVRERKRFRDFTCSPYFNKSHDAIALLDYINRFEPQFSSEQLNKEAAFSYLYPNEPMNVKKVGYALSDLNKLVDQFLAAEQLFEEPRLRYISLLTKALSFDDERLFINLMKEGRKWQSKQQLKDAASFEFGFELDRLDNQLFDKQRKHGIDDKLQSAIDNLDFFYLTTKLKFSSELQNRSNLLATGFHSKLLDEIVEFLDKNPSEQEPAVQIYRKIYSSLSDAENEQHYTDLKALISKYSGFFSDREARDMHAFAINFCIKKANLGNRKFLTELFDQYRIALDKGVLFDGKYLTPWTFKNIVSAGIAAKEYDWVESFITQHKESLRTKFRENAVFYNRAVLFFSQGKFEQSMSNLRKVEFTDVFYATDYRALLLRLYYELQEIEPLYSLVESFSVYLNRNKLISDHYRSVYLNMLKFVRKLIKLGLRDHEKANAMLEELEQTPAVAYKAWLKEKISENCR